MRIVSIAVAGLVLLFAQQSSAESDRPPISAHVILQNGHGSMFDPVAQLSNRVDALTAQVAALRGENAQLKGTIAQIQAKLQVKLGMPQGCEEAGWAPPSTIGGSASPGTMIFTIRNCHG
ncbi:MAG: hypothetical protein WDM86_02245 [Rhizomicrobium sp.]